jgi:hypothetical protein
MNSNLKNRVNKSKAGQTGQALIIVLVFFLLGSLTLTPVLMHMATALKSQSVYEKKTNELFTADAGIETGLWRIKYDFMGPDYDPYDYDTVWPYETDGVNGLSADVLVQNIWLPSNATLGGLGLDAADAKTMIDSEKLLISGTSGAVPGQPFHVKLDFTPADGDNLTIKSIGVWLPQGFTYTAGDSELEHLSAFNPCRPDSVSIDTVPGGSAVVWSYNSPYPLFNAFPNYAVEDGTMTFTFYFNYDPPADDPNKMPLAVAWVLTDMDPTCINANDVPISWDTDMRYYRVVSTTGNTDIETFSSKSQLRSLGNGIAGDYVAIGNSVMLDNVSPYDRRDYLMSESSTDVADVAEIPEDGDVLYAYLYWSGFRFSTEMFTDSCTSTNSWTGNFTGGTQTRVPTGDGDNTGSWTVNPATPVTFYDKVDETSPNDTDYIVGVTDSSSYYRLFTFDSFSLPDLPIANVTVYFRAKDASSGTNDIRACIKYNGTPYPGSSNNPGNSFATYNNAWTSNPATSAPWTAAEINSHLQQFGVYSTDLNPDVDVSMVYITVTYNPYWSIYSSSQLQFQGVANSQVSPRYLTLKTAINMASYNPAAGRFALYLSQSESGTLEADDTLYYALSSNNGTTWSEDHELFSDDSPSSSYYEYLDQNYMNGNLKIRFYCNFNSADEYARLDNIKLFYMPADTSVKFKIDGEQLYFDGSGDPLSGNQSITASYNAVLINGAGLDSNKYGYSYACYKDVTDLVQKYPEVPGEEHHNGSYEFTVGDITADVGQYISYAGWSLIIIYASPDTAGHYIYLRDIHDIFAFEPGGVNLDFDNNGEPGGDVTGFLFPEPIRDKYGNILDTVAAKLTCFVGEGDVNYTGDTLQITGQQSELDEFLSNDESPSDNIWNSASPGMSYPGVDVDTFLVYWEDGILTPKDTSLHLDMQSGTDAWNLIYFIMSVRSETVTSGTGHYTIAPD